MTKIIYPEAGLKKSTNGNYEKIISNLVSAESVANSFDVPEDFEMADYLFSMPSLISDFFKKIDTIKEELDTDDNNYNSLSDTIKSNFTSIDIIKISKRDPIING